jgi:hypothetical protein
MFILVMETSFGETIVRTSNLRIELEEFVKSQMVNEDAICNSKYFTENDILNLQDMADYALIFKVSEVESAVVTNPELSFHTIGVENDSKKRCNSVKGKK